MSQKEKKDEPKGQTKRKNKEKIKNNDKLKWNEMYDNKFFHWKPTKVATNGWMLFIIFHFTIVVLVCASKLKINMGQ